MSISGMSGLFKVVAQTKSGFIVESLIDKKRTAVQSTQKISMLDDISVFTADGEKPLKEVLLSIKEKDKDKLPVNPKSEPAELKSYFKTVIPDYDEERVYASDIKKIISWYGLVKDIVTKEEEPKEQEAAIGEEKEKAGSAVAEEKKVGEETVEKMGKKPAAKTKKKNAD